jgi:hypothetical protein
VRRLSAEACANFFAHAGYAPTWPESALVQLYSPVGK